MGSVWQRGNSVVRGIILACCLIPLVYEAAGPSVLEADFGSLYSSGTIVGPDLYDLDTQEKAYERAVGIELSEPLPYYNPPFYALLFVPLSRIPYRVAYVLWGVLNLGFLAKALDRLRIASPRGVLLTICFPPVLAALVHGQTSLLILWAMVECFSSLQEKRDRNAGMYLAIGLVKPQMVVPTLVLLLWKKRWEALRGFALVAGPLLLLSVVAVGVDGVRDYAELLAEASRWSGRFGIYTEAMFNWRGTLTRMAIHHSPWWYAWGGATLVAIAVSAILALQVWRRSWLRDFPLKYAVLVLVSLVTSQHLYIHDLTLLVLVGALVGSAPILSAGYAAISLFLVAGVMPSAQMMTLLMAAVAAYVSVRILLKRERSSGLVDVEG